MSAVTNHMQPRVVTLPAGVETDLFFDDEGMDVESADSVQVTLEVRKGSPAVETFSRYETSLSMEGTDPTNYGPLAGGVRTTLTFDDVRGSSMRFTGTSASGTTLTIEAVARSLSRAP